MNFQTILLIIPPILLALTFHEYMHGYVAYRLGDNTARDQGRLTFNPLVHLDPIGTLMIFLVHFGWAKPVPVNPYNMNNPKKDMIWVSIAGPAANMTLALISGIIIRIFQAGAISGLARSVQQPLMTMVYFSMQINIALAFFNLIPIPPLDGSKILAGFLPPEQQHITDWLEQYGAFLLMGLILFGFVTKISIIGFILRPFINFFSMLFGGV